MIKITSFLTKKYFNNILDDTRWSLYYWYLKKFWDLNFQSRLITGFMISIKAITVYPYIHTVEKFWLPAFLIILSTFYKLFMSNFYLCLIQTWEKKTNKNDPNKKTIFKYVGDSFKEWSRDLGPGNDFTLILKSSLSKVQPSS